MKKCPNPIDIFLLEGGCGVGFISFGKMKSEPISFLQKEKVPTHSCFPEERLLQRQI
jgi:hypothetical protein